ncbi:hypothetical protein MTBPR1_90069 [Candidatus Terasakiella magnetica]|uniref:SnoaL-like domain-containing protein n=1 Tax=Candidatus Terasakiella magnetica TaxID=1867952 RepID=A0A1C3RLN6_9PROT|nr:hypothetical protein [Candidatus Terasakiella magnetica]SCA58222.1 hypothetical protein MTBPR1_90069 [Candidatus Terasakiella magnetica]
MLNRVKTVEVTKAYADAFNDGDVAAIGEMLDDENVIFSRQEQSSIVGKENVLRRIRNLFWRANEQNVSMTVVNAIADLGKTKARPCLICLRNGVPVALCVLSCKVNGKINAIAILLAGGVVASARATEPIASLENEKDEDNSENRKQLLDITKVYIEKFNRRDLVSLGFLFDEYETVFHRSDQQAIVGRNNIITRIKDLYRRVDKHAQSLHVVNAIIDVDGKSAWPCTLGVLDGTPVSVGLLKLRLDGIIRKIDISLDSDMVAKARPTEPIPEPKPKPITLEQVLEREEWLHNRMKKIKKAMKKQGNLPHLMTKKMRVEQQLQKVEYLKKKLG